MCGSFMDIRNLDPYLSSAVPAYGFRSQYVSYFTEAAAPTFTCVLGCREEGRGTIEKKITYSGCHFPSKSHPDEKQIYFNS